MIDSSPAHHRFRSGTAARLAGLPVTTLRVWERRYAVVAGQKSAGGQRLYSPPDVSRLKLLRELTQAGHPIGTIATPELDSLSLLRTGMSATPDSTEVPPVDVVVVGREAAHAVRSLRNCMVRAVYDDLEQARAAVPIAISCGLLVVRLASLQPGDVDLVLALAASPGVHASLVLYGFGTRASIRALRDTGTSVRREPVTEGDLAQWVRSVSRAPLLTRSPDDASQVVAPRAFTDEQLARLSTMPSRVACECLRHMAEIVSQLAGFERYSRECASPGSADAALHRELSRTAGSARTLFELALQRVVEEERLELTNGPG